LKDDRTSSAVTATAKAPLWLRSVSHRTALCPPRRFEASRDSW